MLNKLKLQNFRKHTDASFNFGPGLSVLRGNNEIGKSTLFEGVAYTLFGVGALRDSLDEVVSWGSPVNTLKAELELGIDGVTYEIKRSKSGAELTSDGLTVTGQKEVSAYVAKLLKVDAGAAARLTLSNQLEIRGTLEAGPKATTELIERLAEFDQIDNLIELMQEKLTLGSSATVEAAVAAAQATLDMATEAAVPFDEADMLFALEVATGRAERAQRLEGEAAKAESVAQEAHTAVRGRIIARDNLVRNATQAADRALELRGRLSVALPVVVSDVDAKVETLRQEITDAENASAIAVVYRKVSPFLGPRATGKTFNGPTDVLRTNIAVAEGLLSKLKIDATKLDGEIKLRTAELTHGSCTFCGKDFSGVPEVAERNAATQKALDFALAAKVTTSAEIKAMQENLAELRAFEEASRPALAALANAGTHAVLADEVLPPVLRWVGPSVDAPADIPALRRTISDLQASQRAYDTAAARRSEVESQLALADAAAIKALAELEAVGPAETLELAQTTLDAARQATAAARAECSAANSALTEAKRALQDQRAAYERAKALVESSKAALAKRKRELVTLEFNNALLKRVRQCRPAIADKLWTIVLAAVSSYFSEIRGVKSRVTKDSTGFRVDDHSVSSMSGSTLDALGLAIRVALVRTFLPSAPFLLLDEPSAAMDADRTGNMLGFLSSCGFQQTIVASHEEVSSDIANHIIAL